MPRSKTEPGKSDVVAYLDAIDDQSRRHDCLALSGLMGRATGADPRMWGTSIVGFGDLHYRYDSGREGDTFLVGFASRKGDITVYLGPALASLGAHLSHLGKHKVGKGCLYLRRLDDVNASVLSSLLAEAVALNAKTAVPRAS